MKRGLIAWNREEMPPAALETRLRGARGVASSSGVPALVVYTDVWRSNRVRFLTNFMPYWNRALLVVPVEGEPILLCSLSARVYPWIREMTPLQDIRPAKDPAALVVELAAERGWKRIGLVDPLDLPYDLHRTLSESGLDVVVLGSSAMATADETELAVRRKAARLTRQIVEESLGLSAAGVTDFELVSRLERALRRAGMEDLVLWISDGRSPPRPPRGVTLGESFSAVVAAEYRGHWVQVARAAGREDTVLPLRERFQRALKRLDREEGGVLYLYELSGSLPFRALADGRAPATGALVAVHLADEEKGRYRFYGDTCQMTGPGAATVL